MENTKKIQQHFQSTLLQEGWVSSAELQQLLQNADTRKPLEQLLLEAGILTLSDIQKVWNKVRHNTSARNRFGKYEIIEPIARGAMGLIYKVRHQELDQIYALKVILSVDANASESVLTRFYREARTTAKLKHPHIVQVVDFGESHHQPYLVMEYLEGKTLEETLQQKLSVDQGISLMKKILSALDYAHQQGVLHRDLKPGNIFITATGEPKIGDFGLAKDLEIEADTQQLTLVGEVLGTPSYMPPEQAAGEIQELDFRADLYSAGACLYRILTQRCPFESDSLPKLFYQIIAEDPLPPSRYNPQIHPDLDAIVLKSLEKSKEKRYASAKEFAQDLDHFQRGYPLIARPSTFLERFYKRVRRNTNILIPLGVLVLLLIGIFFYFQWKQASLKQTHRTTLFQESQHLYTTALDLPQPPPKGDFSRKPSLKQKFEWLLESLYKLNTAISLFPNDPILEHQKFDILNELLRTALGAREYEFAGYLMREISKLPQVKEQEKLLLMQHLEQEKTKRLQAHLARLDYWLMRFKEGGLLKEERESALFEISRMTEVEIYNKLEAILDSGSTYFLEDQTRSIPEDYFYQTIALILGYSGQASAGNILFHQLKKLAQKVRQYQRQRQEWTDIYFVQYLITLTQALGALRVPHLSQEIQEIRLLFGEKSIYWKETEVAYQRLQEAEIFSAKTRSMEEMFSVGKYHLQQKEWESALFLFSTILEQHPQHSEALHSRALAYYHQGNYQEALHDFRQELEVRPNAIAYFYCGVIANLQEDWNQALQDLNQALHYDPEKAEAYYQRGYSLERQGKIAESLQDYEKTLQRDPSNAKAYHQRGQILMQQNAWDSALSNFSEAIRLQPQESSFYRNRGQVKHHLQDLEGALQDFSKAIEYDSQGALAYFYRAQIRREKKEIKEAMADYQRALQLDPQSEAVYYERGCLYYEIQQYEDALTDLDRSIVLNAYSAEKFCLRAKIWVQQKKFSNALNDYAQALFIDPTHQKASHDRDTLKKQIQEEEAALEILLKNCKKYFQENDLERATQTLEEFLKQAPADHPDRPRIQKLLQQLQDK